MVDKSIGELVAASQINDNDLFVLEQSGEAKKLLGNLLKQYINRNVMSVSVSALPPDSEPTVSYDPNTGALELGIPRGEKGESGESSAGYVSGIVKGDGAGDVSAAVAGTDYAAMTNLHGRNLLDNPWFTVNQRGQSSYGNGYFVDRWRHESLSQLTVNDNGISFVSGNWSGGIVQLFEKEFFNRLSGKDITISILDTSGEVHSQTISGYDPSQSYWGTTDPYISVIFERDYTTSAGRLHFVGSGASKTYNIRAVKLELGSVSTLANDTAPNYAEELAKCQRYFQTIGNTEDIFVIGYGIKASSTAIRWVLPIQNMRTIPTVTKIKAADAILDFVGNSGDRGLSSISMTPVGIAPNGVTFVSEGLSNLSDAVYICQAVRVRIELSADL